MDAIIKLDVPDWQIGKPVAIFFPDTMMKKSVCEPLKEPRTRLMTIDEVWNSESPLWFEWYDKRIRADNWAMVNRQVTMDIGEEKPVPFTEIKFYSGGVWCCCDERYNKAKGINNLPGWRCWTKKPTMEEAKAVKWDD